MDTCGSSLAFWQAGPQAVAKADPLDPHTVSVSPLGEKRSEKDWMKDVVNEEDAVDSKQKRKKEKDRGLRRLRRLELKQKRRKKREKDRGWSRLKQPG